VGGQQSHHFKAPPQDLSPESPPSPREYDEFEVRDLLSGQNGSPNLLTSLENQVKTLEGQDIRLQRQHKTLEGEDGQLENKNRHLKHTETDLEHKDHRLESEDRKLKNERNSLQSQDKSLDGR
jgi:chromosome segregation ATPase